MTRVCFVCGNIYPLLSNRADLPVIGGAEVQQYLIANGLAQSGFEVSFVSEDFGQGAVTTAGGFEVFGYRLSRNKLLQARTLWQALRRADAEIYYVRGLPKFSVLIYLFARWHRRRLVQALAHDREVEPELIEGRAHRLTYEFNFRWRARADVVIAQSRFQAERLRERWGVPAQIFPSLVSVPPAPPPRQQFSVLWVGGIRPHKQVERVAEIAAQLPQVNFVVAGGPMRGFEAYYEQTRAQLAQHANVRWLGFVPYADIRRQFESASVLLHTSTQEGFPNVFLQAWAAGMPVVSTGVDPDGLIAQRGLGLFVDPAEAAQAIARLHAEPELVQDIGRRARAYVSAVHHPDVVLPRYAALFQQLAGPAPAVVPARSR
jgi:glycosyltransferase involved in cell wall biosynthesis